MEAPSSINLTTEDPDELVERWRGFMQGSIGAAVKPSDHQLRLRLNSSNDVLAAAVDLAQQEKARRAVLDFSIEVHLDACWLVITAPDDDASAITELAGLLAVDLGRGARAG